MTDDAVEPTADKSMISATDGTGMSSTDEVHAAGVGEQSPAASEPAADAGRLPAVALTPEQTRHLGAVRADVLFGPATAAALRSFDFGKLAGSVGTEAFVGLAAGKAMGQIVADATRGMDVNRMVALAAAESLRGFDTAQWARAASPDLQRVLAGALPALDNSAMTRLTKQLAVSLQPALDASAKIAASAAFRDDLGSLQRTADMLSKAVLPAHLLSQHAITELGVWTRALPAYPSPAQQRFGGAAGLGIVGLVTAEAGPVELLADPVGDEPLVEEVTDAWAAGTLMVRQQLLVRLNAMDPKIADLLQGAWHDLTSDAPGRVASLANFGTELIDRTLRHVAPDEAITAWVVETQQEPKRLQHAGGWTRSARIRFAFRGRPGERKLVQAEVDSLVAQVAALVPRLQASKHASADDIARVRALLLAAEAFLAQIVLE
jgi:hypothetical protein